MNWFPVGFLRTTSLFVLVAFTGLLVQGCVSTKVVRIREDVREPLSIRYLVYLSQADVRDGLEPVSGVISELYYHKDRELQLVLRSDRGSWKVTDLVPGRYTIRIVRRRLPDGSEEELTGKTERTFELLDDERVDVRVILEKTPVGLIVGLTVTVVAIVGLLVYLIAKEDIDLDFPVPVFSGWYGPFWVPEPYFRLSMQMVTGLEDDFYLPNGSREGYPTVTTVAPDIQDYEPRDGFAGVSPDTDIRFWFGDHMDTETLDQNSILLTTSTGRFLPFGLVYDDESGRCILDPLHDFPAGEQVFVTILGDGIRNQAGVSLPVNYRWSFTVQARSNLS